MAQAQRVLVVGGGIGGMAAAICLRRLGSAVELIEIDPAWKVYGAGITVTGASLRALDALGVLGKVRKLGHIASGLTIYSPSGQVLTRFPGRVSEPIHATGGILRPVLHGILSEATRSAGVRVQLGRSVAAVEPASDGVAVAFDDGERGTYDLVIGADGIHSRVRSLFFPGATEPRFTGQGCWRLLTERAPELETGAMIAGGPVPLGFVPVSATQMYMFLLEHVAAGERHVSADAADRLRSLLSPFGGIVARVRDHIEPSAIVYRPLEAVLMPEPWFKGRVLLLGDAAHATTPHLATGAGLAVEDALVLADELTRAPDIDEGLARHAARRYARCRDVVNLSLEIGERQMQKADFGVLGALMQRGMELLTAPY